MDRMHSLTLTNVVVVVVKLLSCSAGQQSLKAFGERRSNQQNQLGGNMFYCMTDGIQQHRNNSDWPEPSVLLARVEM